VKRGNGAAIATLVSDLLDTLIETEEELAMERAYRQSATALGLFNKKAL